jgi:hypothetical protein
LPGQSRGGFLLANAADLGDRCQIALPRPDVALFCDRPSRRRFLASPLALNRRFDGSSACVVAALWVTFFRGRLSCCSRTWVRRLSAAISDRYEAMGFFRLLVSSRIALRATREISAFSADACSA